MPKKSEPNQGEGRGPPEDTLKIGIPRSMAERVAKRLPDSGFATVDEYVTYILKTVLDELDGSSQSTPHPQAGFTEADEEAIKRKLSELGYL